MPLVLATDANPGVAAFRSLNELDATPPLFVTTFGTTLVSPAVSLVVCTLGATGAAQLQLPSDYPTSVELMITRTDDVVASTFTILPNVGAQINGAASLAVADVTTKGGPSGLTLAYDGTNWWTTGAT